MKSLGLKESLLRARLYVLLTTKICKTSPIEVARLAIKGGADALQLRGKDLPDTELLKLALELRGLTRATSTLFMVNDRPDIALEAQADGLHIGQGDLPIKEARYLLGADRLIGVSTHDIDQARKAQAEGADYLGVGPIFPTQTKPQEKAVGLEVIRQLAREIDIPFFAIGGIDTTNLGAVLRAGARRVAVSSAIIAQEDVLSATRGFRLRLKRSTIARSL